MKFLNILAGFVLLFLPLKSMADAVYVVEIASFSCSFCRQAESAVSDIERAVGATGGKFIFAPLSWESGDGNWDDRLYYAARSELAPSQLSNLRKALYAVKQDYQVAGTDLGELVNNLETLIPQEAPWQKLMVSAENDSTLIAWNKAGGLAYKSGASNVPVYLVMNKLGDIVSVVERKDNITLLDQITAVKAAIASAAKGGAK